MSLPQILFAQLGSWALFFAAGASLAFIAQCHRTLPVMQLFGLFGLGLTSLLAAIGLQQENPCTTWQFYARVTLFGTSLLALICSMIYQLNRRGNPYGGGAA